MRVTNYEDLIMKRAMDIFAQDGLKFFGIDKKVKEPGPTELVVLNTKNMFMDYTFLMEDDTYIHFEFQTTNKNTTDLRRFRGYEALLSHQTGKDVITYVVYSGNIINANDTLETGINKFKVNTISMASKNGDDVFDYICDKINKGISLSKDDIISLSFIPIMGGKVSKLDRILNTIKVLKDIDNTYRHDVESIIYAFANKFLSGKDLDRVKEELKVTELGKSLIDEGKKEKAIEIAKKAILKGMDNETIRDLTDLSIDDIELIRKVMN
ncbi:hypothetical protein QOZ83_15935 [Romboutsia sedimentorum]|uniref:hypothetical protein n=1 Tax=Romboutsia sedimentorum TaxID=1368474 RepID=UPI0024DE7188|nr:hypothetical protein [Romboutsia sedimentorum]MDK2587337.1 hypothetical protein [Romboutsia sedimentorum]